MSSPLSATDVLTSGSSAGAAHRRLVPRATGFEPLDSVLGGGLHTEDLVLVGGRPGIGKTVATLQWARHMAGDGHRTLYACYEHSERALAARLLTQELGALARPEQQPDVDKLRDLAREVTLGACTVSDFVEAHPLAADAYEAFRTYSDRLHLVRATPRTGLEALQALTTTSAGDVEVLFVDYLQKVPVPGRALEEAERVTLVAEGLKDLALAREVALVATVAADREGLLARRLRLHHLRGSTALAHEADVVITMTEKFSAVSKAHLAYDTARARTFHQWVVVTVEKNREGPADLALEFRKDFANFRFDPRGGFVREQLVDDVVVAE